MMLTQNPTGTKNPSADGLNPSAAGLETPDGSKIQKPISDGSRINTEEIYMCKKVHDTRVWVGQKWAWY